MAAADADGDGDADLLARTSSDDIMVRLSAVRPVVHPLPDFEPDPSVTYDETPALEALSGQAVATAAAARKRLLLGWADQGMLQPDYLVQFDRSIFDESADRVREAGGKVVRFVVLWGRWENSDPNDPNSYRAELEEAVGAARQEGFQVYLTLTGADYDEKVPGQTPGSQVATHIDPDPDDFGAFVEDVVTEFAPRGVHAYGIWNEPNLERFLIHNPCPTGKPQSRSTVEVYAELWQAGAAAVRRADPKGRALFGELSSNSADYRRSCTTRQATMKLTTATYFGGVAVAVPGGIKADGLAWHPYEAGRPSMKNPPPNITGISSIRVLKTAMEAEHKAGRFSTPGPSGKVPQLWITEFGYLNRPSIKNAPKNSFLTESQRAARFPLAFNIARGKKNGHRQARMFILYGLAEELPAVLVGRPTNETADTPELRRSENFANGQPFDTGVVGVEGDHLEAGGLRRYGKGGAQCRLAYMSIRRWARNNGSRPAALTDQPQPC